MNHRNMLFSQLFILHSQPNLWESQLNEYLFVVHFQSCYWHDLAVVSSFCTIVVGWEFDSNWLLEFSPPPLIWRKLQLTSLLSWFRQSAARIWRRRPPRQIKMCKLLNRPGTYPKKDFVEKRFFSSLMGSSLRKMVNFWKIRHNQLLEPVVVPVSPLQS